MNVAFRTRKPARCFQYPRLARSAWGRVVADRYLLRVNQLQALPRFEALPSLHALDARPLSGLHQGEISVTLDGPWRLILTHDPQHDTITIEDVSDHHDDA